MSIAARVQSNTEPMVVSTVSAAVVVAAIAPMLAEPHVSSGQVSQQLAGHVVSIVEDQGDWLLVRGRDGYEGWTHRGYLAKLAAARDGGDERISLGCVVASATGSIRSLPLRAVVAAGDRIQSGEAIPARELTVRFPTDATAICGSAVALYVGTPY